ncbi:MAG: hypothetical protein DRR08_14440 [Candidatus Parabeggiatoa sp. nov. 2]|nr:MAG: hypothetical protein DRR08_14440 [Gammaproteobacteria bacterium]
MSLIDNPVKKPMVRAWLFSFNNPKYNDTRLSTTNYADKRIKKAQVQRIARINEFKPCLLGVFVID